jgi:alpha-1,2-mannosyltransferase
MRVTDTSFRQIPVVGLGRPGPNGTDSGAPPPDLRKNGHLAGRTKWLKSWWLPWCALGGALAYSLSIAIWTKETDLLVYLMGGRLARTPALYTSVLPHTPLPFTYTPLAALLFAPFGWAGIGAAREVPTQVIWTLFNMATLLGLIVVSIRAVRPAIPRTERWRLALLLSFPAVFLDPVMLTIGFGQINLMLALLVLWDLLGDRKIGSHTLPLGVATGIAVAIKLTPAIFIPYMFLTGRRRGALNCVITFLVCDLLGFALSPGASWLFWTKDVFKPSRTGGLLYLSDQNLSSAIQRFDHAPLGTGVLAPVVLAIGVGGVALAVWAHRRSSPVLGTIVCATTGLIVSPVTWVHHLVWVVPAIVWLAAAPDAPRLGKKIAVAVAVLFWAAPMWWVPRDALDELQLRGWQMVAGNSFLLAMLVFLFGVILLLIRREWAHRRGPFGRIPDRRVHAGQMLSTQLPQPQEGTQARTPSVP